MNVITRFPPSPTGFFHIGSARTALFNYLFAAHHGGTMSMRFEDTDTARSKREFEDDILAGLKWLGIEYEMPKVFRQSEKTHDYRKYLKQLIDSGHAYEAEAGKDDPTKKVIRFKNPDLLLVFHDLIRGEISVETKDLSDFVIARNIDDPLYHLSVVIDDHETGVTHVIRGEDHISNTPRQILILEALGFQRPLYAHIPLILAPDRSKLSKRHGAVSINEYREQGFLPQALVNYIALLGWNSGGEKELFSMQELIQSFDLEQVQKGGAIFDIEKLKWFNKEYFKKMPEQEFDEQALGILKDACTKRSGSFNDDVAKKLLPIIRERISLWGDIKTMVENGELDYFFYDPHPTAAEIPQKGSTKEIASLHLKAALQLLAEIDFADAETIKKTLWDYATEKGRGEVLWPLRYSLSGKDRSPDPFVIASIIGKEASLRRISAALIKLASGA